MTHPLETRIRSLGRLAQFLAIASGAGWVVCVLVLSGVLMACLDYSLYILIGLDDMGVRVVLSMALVISVAVGIFYFLLPAIQYRWNEIEIAQRVEKCFPQLRDRLSSAVDFLKQSVDDQTAGSASLRRAVVADAESLIDDLNIRDIVRYRPATVITVVALLLLSISGVLLAGWRPARLAAMRLAMPWAEATWPKRNDLQFIDPPFRLALGDDLELRVRDANGNLPENVDFQYKSTDENSEQRTQHKQMKLLDGEMVARLENVTRSLQFRAVGGDDESPWHPLNVLAAPLIDEMVVRLTPPKYTHWPTAESSNHIRALQGSSIRISGSTSKPLSKLVLNFETDGETTSRDVARGEDGTTFTFPADDSDPWLVDAAGEYWFELTDQDDLVGGRNQRWRIQPMQDNPPVVSLDKPKGNAFVTPAAVVALECIVKDDIAIHEVELRYLLSGKSERGEQFIELYKAKQIRKSESTRDEARTIKYEWKLASLGQLEPGQTIDFHIAATDYRPQTGVGPRRQLTIITQDDLEDRIGQRQSYILSQLAEVLRTQREARGQTKGIEIQFDEAGVLRKDDVDQMQSAELNQRQVVRLLSGEDGVESQIVAVLADLKSNRIDSPDVHRRMTTLLGEVRRINREYMTAVQRELVGSLKTARGMLREKQPSEVSKDSEVYKSLTAAGVQQEKAIEALEDLLGEYSEWDNFRRFARDIRRVRRQQDDLVRDTSELPKEILGKNVEDLSAQEKAKLKILGNRQLELGRRFDAIRSRMEQMQSDLSDKEPLVAKTLGDAVESALLHAIGGQMREVGRDIENNRRGHANQLQQRVSEGLEEVMDILANRREQELEQLVDKLNETAGEIDELREQQEGLREKIERASGNPNEAERKRQLQMLTKQQQQLAERAERLARRLQRLRAERASQSMQQAGASMQKAGESAAQGGGDSALEEAKKAEQELENARQQLQQAIAEAEQELYQEKLAKLKQRIEGLVIRQQSVIEETLRLDDVKKTHSELTAGQKESVRSLSREQRGLAADTGILADKVSDAEAFALALRGAVREMLRAARRLDNLDTGPDAQRSERIAKSRLDQLVQALTTDEDENQPPENENGQGGQQGQGSPGEMIQLLAQLKLLRLMQQELNRRTSELEEARMRRGGMFTREQQREVDDLAIEQGKLADLVFNLTQPVESNPEDNPETLPAGNDR